MLVGGGAVAASGSDFLAVNHNAGGEVVLTVDVPYFPIGVEQVESADSPAANGQEFLFDYCQPIQVLQPGPTVNKVSALLRLKSALEQRYGQDIDFEKLLFAVVSLPSSGNLFSVNGGIYYEPNEGFLGGDEAVIAARYGDKAIRILIKFVATDNFENGGEKVDNCFGYKERLLKIGELLPMGVDWQHANGVMGYNPPELRVIFEGLENQALGEFRKGGAERLLFLWIVMPPATAGTSTGWALATTGPPPVTRWNGWRVQAAPPMSRWISCLSSGTSMAMPWGWSTLPIVMS